MNENEKVLTDETFGAAIEKGITLVDFYADWCQPCRMLSPTIAAIAEDYSGQTFMLAAHIGEMPWLRTQPSAKYLRYVDVVVGFKTRNYKPDPDPELGKQRRQTLFLGLSLNAQAVWDDVFARQRKLRRIGHGIFEVANLPYTSLPLVKATRSPDD